MESRQSLNFTTSSPTSYTDEEFYNKISHLNYILNGMFCSIIFILGTVGNGLVIWITGFRMKKTVNTIWFLNLGIADFSFCLFLPFQILSWALDYHWHFGQIMCKVVCTSFHLNMQVSIFFLMAISVDRCTSVLCPVWSKNHRSVKLAKNISVIIWLFSLTLSSPYLVFYDTGHIPDSNITYCGQTYAAWKNTSFDSQTFHLRRTVMSFTNLISMFLIPFSIILVCYGLIAFWIRKSSKRLGSSRTFKTIVATVLCFFCCSFFFHLLHLLDFIEVDINSVFANIMSNVAESLAIFNSCLNPMIYVFVGRDFKISLRKSIPFLLESAFREEKEDPLEAHDNAGVGIELVPCHA
ncbi:formyl peptide receptor-related sequence 4 [Xenopus laevis]|uniref:Formyl peptide receptor-related sequence 4 n=2 Tax=Xenopus laevis TaxID=8355 RepID=A0A1L8FNX6_XENLA|nr:formyl peptide receptor-related sequence 4 [Xenopus laevis]OCT73296.1 hypothetical protein XELAEV_18036277mg [Xenopus laevis]